MKLCCTMLHIWVIFPLLALKGVSSIILYKTKLTLSFCNGDAFHTKFMLFPSPPNVYFSWIKRKLCCTMLHIWVIFPLLAFKGVFSVLLFSLLHCRYCLLHLHNNKNCVQSVLIFFILVCFVWLQCQTKVMVTNKLHGALIQKRKKGRVATGYFLTLVALIIWYMYLLHSSINCKAITITIVYGSFIIFFNFVKTDQTVSFYIHISFH